MTCVKCQDGAWQRDFESDLKWGAGLANSTLRCVRYELPRWARWLSDRGRCWHRVTRCDLVNWMSDALACQAPKTVDKRIWVLRRLYRWATLEGLVDEDPWRRIVQPVNPPQWQPRYVPTRSQVMDLLEQPDTRTLKGIRDRAILELLYGAGLRASELISLNTCQISAGLEDGCIKVMGKGQHERLVIYGKHAAFWLRHYMNAARSELLRRAGAVEQFFVNDTPSGELTYPVMRRAVKRYASAASLPLVTAHGLRHAFATHLYQNGANLRVIQMLLGHAMLETTTAYARACTEHMRTLIERHHPRGELYVPLPTLRERWRSHQDGRLESVDADLGEADTSSSSTDYGSEVSNDRWLHSIKKAT